MKHKDLAMGGQAVIEGVMMKSPTLIVTSVRKTTGEIVSKVEPYVSVTRRYAVLGIPVLRGAVMLFEQLYLGMKSLTFSAEVVSAGEGEVKEKRGWTTALWAAVTIIVALGLGLLLFFYVPLVIAGHTGVRGSVLFNLVDGAVRLAIFFIYLALLNAWKDMRRVFEYHGAEHKSIHAYEHGEPLEVEKVKKYTTRHPRCGTSFLLIVMVVSIIVFIFMGRPDNVRERLLRLVVVPVIAGISYEVTRLAGKHREGAVMKIITAPGLALQRFTTREPSDDQIEVALEALKQTVAGEAGA
ncbi:MAG TPA: DUF1385 domain-containing protein [bacterium]|nr:DUF1385 domain-containing protein [bacterium]